MMKRYFLASSLLIFMLTAITSCVKESLDIENTVPKGQLQFDYLVKDGQTTDVVSRSTRATPASSAEKRVDALLVLYFQPETTPGMQDGAYLGFVETTTNDNGGSGTARASLPQGYQADQAFNLIIIANHTRYIDTGGESLKDYLSGLLDGRSESYAINNLIFTTPSISQNYNVGITSPGLPMSCSVKKAANTDVVPIVLERAVARIDIENKAANLSTKPFVMRSVWVYNANKTTNAFNPNGTLSSPIAGCANYYNNKATVTVANQLVSEKFYVFENFTTTPKVDDMQTTCLIVGGYFDGSSNETFYRINVLPSLSTQALKRNYIYRINITSVSGPGADSPEEAWKSGVTVRYTFNQWDDNISGQYAFDENGNGLAVSLRNLTFASLGGKVEIEIFRIVSSTNPITSDWSVAMTSELQSSNFTATKVTGQNRFVVDAPSENLTSADRRGVAKVTWGGISLPIDIRQLNHLSQMSGLKISPSYLRFRSGTSSKQMTVSLEGNFSGVTEANITPAVIYETVGETWLSTTYNDAASNPAAGVFVYDVACDALPDGKDYRMADIKVAVVQDSKVATGTISLVQSDGLEGDDFVRRISTQIYESPLDNGVYNNLGSTIDQYQKFYGMPEGQNGYNHLHFPIVNPKTFKYTIRLASSMDWRIVPTGMTLGNVNFSMRSALGEKDKEHVITITVDNDAGFGWEGEFYIEFENGDRNLYIVHQQGVISSLGTFTTDNDGNPYSTERADALYYYGTFRMNGLTWLDRNIGAKSNGWTGSQVSDLPKDDNAKGALIPTSVMNSSCPKGFRIPIQAEWQYFITNSRYDAIPDCAQFPGGVANPNTRWIHADDGMIFIPMTKITPTVITGTPGKAVTIRYAGWTEPSVNYKTWASVKVDEPALNWLGGVYYNNAANQAPTKLAQYNSEFNVRCVRSE